MNKTNKDLLQLISIAGVSFFATGIILKFFLPIPQLAVLIDRSYCPTPQWQQLTNDYQQLYRQHQLKQVQLKPVILISSLHEEIIIKPLKPQELTDISTYGRKNSELQLKLQKKYVRNVTLDCFNNASK